MEGGYLPWKNKRKEVVDQLDVVSKPLPPPPHGSYWLQKDSGAWVLRETEKSDEPEQLNSVTIASPTVIEHTVMPSDTLQGICLRYRVNVTDVRRINMFSGNSIQCKKILRIPLTKDISISAQEDTHEVLLQKFRNETGESVAESRVYLEDSAWELEVALGAWRGDDQWEKKQYLDILSKTLQINGQETSLDDCGLINSNAKRTVFASTVDGFAPQKKEISPVAVRVPREVAPYTVIELATRVPV